MQGSRMHVQTMLLLQNLAVANDAVLAQLPSLETMRRDVRRNRQVHQGLPEVPDRGNHLFEIPPSI